MKKMLKFVLAALMVTSLASCGQKTETADTEETPVVTECPITVGLVTDTGGVDDKSFNQSAWEGIKKFQEENNIDDSCISYLQSGSDADYVPNIRTFVDQGTDLIVACGYLFQEAIDTVSAQAPDSKFLFVDSVAANENSNVMSAVYAQEQGSYLVGLAAGLKAKENGSNKVGFIGGMQGDLIGAFQAGFEQGVLEANPEATIYVDYADSFTDASKAQQLADKQYGAGATVIFQAAGSAGNGVIKAAKERGDVWAVGVDKDQYEDGMVDGKSIILTSMLKRVDTSTATASKDVLDGNFKPEVYTFNVANEGVGAELTAGRNLSDEVIATIQEYAEKIANGEIVVDLVPMIENGKTN